MKYYIYKTLFICLFFFIATLTFAENLPHNFQSFSKSKKLMKKVYADHQISFYCGCDYDYKIVKGKQKTIPNWQSCGFSPRKQPKRASRIEWEHVIPAENFGRQFTCWRDGNSKCVKKNGKTYKGRKCCNKVNKKFRAMQADLHNLRPAIGEVNGDRSNYRYSLLPNLSYGQYGECRFKVDFKNRKAEPSKEVRGDIARTYFYFEKVYGLKISKKDRKLFEAWNKQDPVDNWERERNSKIAEIQGNSNTYVD
jgi:deoxyribonuclease-1